MRILSSIAILVLAVFMFAACNSTDRSASNKSASTSDPSGAAKASNPQPDGARRINVQEAHALVSSGQAVVVDVRNQAAYEISHIRGAKLIPVNEVGIRSGELPKDKTIITYCS